MATDTNSNTNRVSLVAQNSFLPFRRFLDRPSTVFIETVLKDLKDNASPELIEELYRNPIPKDAQFFILRHVELDGHKRPNGDNAPCPMCAPNKFLRGALVYIPGMQCCAVIGHCCAGRQAQADADREYRWRKKRDHEESYLLDNMLMIQARLKALQSLKPAAFECRRLYRQFRKQASKIQYQLRQVRKNYGGQLILSEIIRGGDDTTDNDYVGPSGFRGRGSLDIETREHNYGILAGSLATVKNYDPVADLEWLVRQLSSIDAISSEAELLDFIVKINERQRSAAVAIMESVDKGVDELVERMKSFLQFFTRENADRLNAFGTSLHNSFPFEVRYGEMRGRPCMTFRYQRQRCVLYVGDVCLNLKFTWPKKA